MKNNHHHVIPISMHGEHVEKNVILLPEILHTKLHKEQDVPYSTLRRFRENTNGILIPNDKYWEEYYNLMGQFFSGASRNIKEVSTMQINSLLKQANNDYILNEKHNYNTDRLIDRALVLYIDEKKRQVEKILNNYKNEI